MGAHPLLPGVATGGAPATMTSATADPTALLGSSAEMMLFLDSVGVNQSYGGLMGSGLAGGEHHYTAEFEDDVASSISSGLDLDNLPLEQLLQNEWFHHNISHMLNISVDNLTQLLQNANGQSLQPRQMRRPLLTAISVFYALIFVAGILGNLITCIVISRNRFMHTATNFYLFNLAVSDLILLLSGMPQDLYNIWNPQTYPFTDVMCVLGSVLSETAANATVLTITAFTVERYIAICHPFRQHTMSKLSRAIKFIFAIWVTAFLLALPQAMQFSVVTQSTVTACTMSNDFFAHVFAVSGFIFFLFPMTAICVLYVLIGVKLKRSRLLQAVPRRCYDVNRGISAQSRVIRMLVAVAVAFFLCWAPFHAQRLMAVYGSTSNIKSKVFNDIFNILDYTSGVLYFLSTCINPLLYNIMSHKFREAFKVTLARHFGLAGRYQSQNHNYSALLRQNGSMRLHTTDSIRTTTTTTTINSGSGASGGIGSGSGSGNGSAAGSRSSSHRNRCISVGAPAKSDLFAGRGSAAANAAAVAVANATVTATAAAAAASDSAVTGSRAELMQQRLLHRQIAQDSSVDNSNSLLDSDYHPHTHPHPYPNTQTHTHTHAHPHPHPHPHSHSQPHLAASYCFKELRRPLAPATSRASFSANTGASSPGLGQSVDDHLFVHSTQDQTELVTKPVQLVQPLNSIAELTPVQPRSRLKLSRIISRREQDAFAAQVSPRIEVARVTSPSDLSPPAQSGKPVKSGKSAKMHRIVEKLRWQPRRRFPLPANRTASDITTAPHSNSKASPPSAGPGVPTAALMQIVFASKMKPNTSASAAFDGEAVPLNIGDGADESTAAGIGKAQNGSTLTS